MSHTAICALNPFRRHEDEPHSELVGHDQSMASWIRNRPVAA